MKIKTLKTETPAAKRFSAKEWAIADREHYGKNPDFKIKKHLFVAYDQNKIVGRIAVSIKAGVAEVHTVLVGKNHRGKGIGVALMQKAEDITKRHRVHKIWLQTGKGWKAEGFYKKMGYKRGGMLQNHYADHDFVVYSKEL